MSFRNARIVIILTSNNNHYEKTLWIVGLVIVVGAISILALISHNSSNNQPASHTNTAADAVTIGKPAPDATFTTVDGKSHTLAEFKGQKVMLWLLTTWCSSCIAGAQTLAGSNNKLGNLTIIALETYGDAGYPGPSMEAFAQQYVPAMLSASSWQLGNASQEATSIYNPQNYPDIYFF